MRLYIVGTSTGRVCHTRHHLYVRSGPTAENSSGSDAEETLHITEAPLRTGTQIRPPGQLQLKRGRYGETMTFYMHTCVDTT